MRGVARNYRQAARVTRGDLVVEAVVAAILRANGARREQFFKLLDSFAQLIRRQEF
jgi:hypothetical protein